MLRNPFDSDCGLDIATVTDAAPGLVDKIAFWGYRLVLHPDGMYHLHEAYYGHREEILCISLQPTTICADSLDEMVEMLEEASGAMREPVLRYQEWNAGSPSGRNGGTEAR
ncbi:hypothetical protein BH23BAC4_BH23BAC4_08870 [soil metagenome]